MAKFIVGGRTIKRGKFAVIEDTVQGIEDIHDAWLKARKKYPNAPELNVRGMGKAGVQTKGEEAAPEPQPENNGKKPNPFMAKAKKGSS